MLLQAYLSIVFFFFEKFIVSNHAICLKVLYEFIMRVVWITFGYTNWETIQNEIGR